MPNTTLHQLRPSHILQYVTNGEVASSARTQQLPDAFTTSQRPSLRPPILRILPADWSCARFFFPHFSSPPTAQTIRLLPTHRLISSTCPPYLHRHIPHKPTSHQLAQRFTRILWGPSPIGVQIRVHARNPLKNAPFVESVHTGLGRRLSSIRLLQPGFDSGYEFLLFETMCIDPL